MDRIKTLEGLISHYTKERESIIEKHGTGIRSSWVSGDLGFLQMDIDRCKAELANLKNGHQS